MSEKDVAGQAEQAGQGGFGVQEAPDMRDEALTVRRCTSVVFGWEAFVLLAVLVVFSVACMVFVVRQARLTEVTALRVDVLELTARTTSVQGRADSEAQRLSGLMENHNKLVQALTQVFAAQEAKVAALEAKVVVLEAARTNVVAKVEGIEKELERSSKKR